MSEADTIRETAQEALRFLTPESCGDYRTFRKTWDGLRAALDTDLPALERRAEQAEARVERWRGRAAGWQDRAEQAEAQPLSLHASYVAGLERRAEQAEAALREIRAHDDIDDHESYEECFDAIQGIASAALASTTTGESAPTETVTFYAHGTAEAVYEYENAEVPE